MTVRIGTWNLFRPGKDGPSFKDEYDQKLAMLTATISHLAPDVLCVQEVGDPAALYDLVKQLDGTWHTALADPDGRGIRAGVISQTELSNVNQISTFPDALQPV